MQFKVLASTAALAAAMMFAGPAAAQDSMMNGVAIPEAELAGVQARCDELKTAEAAPSESTNESAGDGDLETPGDNDTETASTPTIDLETIDLQACIDAGLVTE